MDKYDFSKMAVEQCVLAMQSGKLYQRHVNAVVKYNNVDVKPIEIFLISDDEFIRRNAIIIIGTRGDKNKLIEMAKTEKNRLILLTILRLLVKAKDGLEELVELLFNANTVIRSQAIEMFKYARRTDCLVGLLFDDDPELVTRVKKYIEEQDAEESNSNK